MNTLRVLSSAFRRAVTGTAQLALPAGFLLFLLCSLTVNAESQSGRKDGRAAPRAAEPIGTRGNEAAPTERAGRPRRSVQARKRPNARADRWSSLSPQKRKQLEKIYDQLKKLPPEKRAQLLERLRRLDSDTRRERIRSAKRRLDSDEAWLDRQSRQTRRELLESLPPGTRERLQKLPARERRKHLQMLVASRRAKLIERLPPDMADEVRRLPPGKQTQRLKQYRTSQLFRQTFQDQKEIDQLRGLPRKELRRLLSVKDAAEAPAPKPDYFSPRTWKRWKSLERFERVRLLRLIRTGGDLRSGRSPKRSRSGRERAGAKSR